jgi:hypothetical protein
LLPDIAMPLQVPQVLIDEAGAMLTVPGQPSQIPIIRLRNKREHQ